MREICVCVRVCVRVCVWGGGVEDGERNKNENVMATMCNRKCISQFDSIQVRMTELFFFFSFLYATCKYLGTENEFSRYLQIFFFLPKAIY